MVTIILFTYNRKDYIRKALDAILNQSYKEFKLYILDNHSTDGTSSIIDSYSDNRIKHIRHQRNIGGIASAKYAFQYLIDDQLVLFTHDDDIMHATMVERQVKIFIKHNDIKMVSTNMNTIDFKDNLIQTHLLPIHQDMILKQFQFIENYLDCKNYVCTPTVMLRWDFIKKNGIMPSSNCGPANDAFMWSEINTYPNGNIYIIEEPLYNYRIHNTQDSSKNRYSMVTDLDLPLLSLIKSRANHLTNRYIHTFPNILIKGVLVDFALGKTDLILARKVLLQCLVRYRGRILISYLIFIHLFIIFPRSFKVLYLLLNIIKKNIHNISNE